MGEKKYIEWEKILRVAGESISGSLMLIVIAVLDAALHKGLDLAQGQGWIDGFAYWAIVIALDLILLIDLGLLVVYIALMGYKLLKENTKNEDSEVHD